MKTIIKDNMELIVPDLIFENDYKPDGWVIKAQPKVETVKVKEVKQEKVVVEKTTAKVSKPKENKK